MAFVELASESALHSALKLHKSVMEGRRINVERTVGGGGSQDKRKQRLTALREQQGSKMRQTVREMCETILGGESDVVPLAGGEEEAEGGGGGGATLDDVDERIEEFLCRFRSRWPRRRCACATLDFTGVRSRSAYLMGVLKRKVADSDRLGGGEGENRQPRAAAAAAARAAAAAGRQGRARRQGRRQGRRPRRRRQGGGRGRGRGERAAGRHEVPRFSPVPPKKPKPKAGGAGSALLEL